MSQDLNLPQQANDYGIYYVIGLTLIIMLLLINAHDWNTVQDEWPVPSVQLPNFSAETSIKAKKAKFFSYLRPLVRQQNQKIRFDQAMLSKLEVELSNNSSHQGNARRKLNKLAKRYNVETNDLQEIIEALRIKIDIIPESLVLVQAAKESGWGTSRFARKANNLFGQWCYTDSCGLIPNKRAEGAKHQLRYFNTPKASIGSYMLNLNSHRAYKNLRQLRAEARASGRSIKGTQLAAGLLAYSERGQAYVDEVIKMIKQNKLE